MFPDAQHPPSRATKKTVDRTIPLAIAVELPSPKSRAVLRPGGMPGASMPETSVHEHGDAEPGENEVGTNPTGGADESQGLGSGV